MITWNENKTITVNTDKKPKKITGTRFAAILGKNKYTTPFSCWCDITHAYEFPYEDTKYTIAGKTIEPIQAQYVSSLFKNTVITPAQMYGDDYFNTTHGDFFSEEEKFGGMWDYLLKKDNETVAVFEMKTTGISHKKDWEKDIPEYYALQAALYASLLHVEKVYMVVSFLESIDYVMPDAYKPNENNTKIIEFNLHERYPNFQDEYILPAVTWWDTYIKTNTSPVYNEVLDKELLNELHKTEENMNLSISTDYEELNGIRQVVKTNVDEASTMLNTIVDNYTSSLDALMQDIQADVVAIDDPPLTVIERYFLELSNAIYFISSKVERLGLYDGMSKLSLKEAFNNSYINNKVDDNGKNRTAAELTAMSEDASKYESAVNDIYNKAYKIVKAKVDAAQTMCSTLSKVYSLKGQQMQSENFAEVQNAKRILNEGV